MDNKKNNSTVITIVILLVVIIFIFIFKTKINQNKSNLIPPVSQADQSINKAVTDDTTKSINDNLNNINLDDTSNTDLAPVDQELQKL